MDMKKIAAKLPVGYADEAAGMDGDKLRAEIVRAETALHEVERELKADEKLTAAREVMKDLVGAYNDVKKAQRAKIAYTLLLLEERGELLTGEFGGDAVTGERPGPSRSKADAKKKSSRAA